MTGQKDFECHDFFDNTNLCILQISWVDHTTQEKRLEWLLVTKITASIKKMQLRNSDASRAVQERYFDLGFLKYGGSSGVFIESAAKDLHHLAHKACEDIPTDYLLAIRAYLDGRSVPM